MTEADTIAKFFATYSGNIEYDLTEVATDLGFWFASYRTSKLKFVQAKSALSCPKPGNLLLCMVLQQAYIEEYTGTRIFAEPKDNPPPLRRSFRVTYKQ